MAFHLHRLGLVGRALREAGYNKNDAAEISAGRSSLNSTSATDLAEQLGIAVQQLTRDLSADEIRAWSFYRRAAADPQHVWRKAQQAWRSANLTDQVAAELMGINTSAIWRSTNSPSNSIVLSFERAAKLTTALDISRGPEVFLPSPRNDTSPISR